MRPLVVRPGSPPWIRAMSAEVPPMSMPMRSPKPALRADEGRADRAGRRAGQRRLDRRAPHGRACWSRRRSTSSAAAARRCRARASALLEPLDVGRDHRHDVGVEDASSCCARTRGTPAAPRSRARPARRDAPRAGSRRRAARAPGWRSCAAARRRSWRCPRPLIARAAAAHAPPRRAARARSPSGPMRPPTSKMCSGGTGRFGFTQANRLARRGTSCRPISST